MNDKKQTPKLLIVDDSPMNLKMLATALKDDYRVAVAKSGKRALAMFEAGKTADLILLDIMMPDLDGFEVCAKLKANDNTRHIPIIFITANDELADEAKALMAGAVDYIVKPFSLPVVKARIRTHLELKRHRDRLLTLSTEDALTGLANRRAFDETLNKEWKRTRRQGFSLAAIMLDVDFFKKYNDGYGHGAGDECLKKLAEVLKRLNRRAEDFPARYGGEEFVILLPGSDVDQAVVLAERCRKAVQSLAITHEYAPLGFVSISLGVAAMKPAMGRDPDELIKAADQALYQAKDAGRNQLRVAGKGMEDSEAPSDPAVKMADLVEKVRKRELSEKDWADLLYILERASR